MRKQKKKSVIPMVLLAASAGLLLCSTVGSTRAALAYYSENYAAEVAVSSIGVSLTENGEIVSRRNFTGSGSWDEAQGELLTKLLEEGSSVTPGREYPERIGVTNSGSIDAYVRVIITKSWMDADGKDTSLSPALIQLNYTGNGWMIDESASTAERTVLYYTGMVPAGGSTPDLTDTIKIDSAAAGKATQTVTESNGQKTITTTYDYDGYQFRIDAEVDAVQAHNVQDAVKSAWGVDVNIAADGSLGLK